MKRELEETVKRRCSSAGVTLVEMMIVVAIVALIAAISYPAVTSGLDTIRLRSASDSIVSFLNAGLNRAERRQQFVEVTISKTENALSLRSADPGFQRRLELPEGVSILRILPEITGVEESGRSFGLYPAGTIPRLGVEIANRKGTRKIVSVDPITGVPVVRQPEQE
ncbi:MAG: pilus assembly FimT family protein [Bryobacteraceae bacterium]